jgi:hypothetical protein
LGDGPGDNIVVAKNSTVRPRNVGQAASDVFIGEGPSDLNQSGSSVHDTVRESDTVSVALPMNGNENDERENVLLNEDTVGLPALFTTHSNSSNSNDVTSAAAPTTTNDVDNVTKKRLSFLSWNVNGLFSKIFDSDFIDFVTNFDFICLVETF